MFENIRTASEIENERLRARAGAIALATIEAKIYSLGPTPEEWAKQNWQAYFDRSLAVLNAADKARP